MPVPVPVPVPMPVKVPVLEPTHAPGGGRISTASSVCVGRQRRGEDGGVARALEERCHAAPHAALQPREAAHASPCATESGRVQVLLPAGKAKKQGKRGRQAHAWLQVSSRERTNIERVEHGQR